MWLSISELSTKMEISVISRKMIWDHQKIESRGNQETARSVRLCPRVRTRNEHFYSKHLSTFSERSRKICLNVLQFFLNRNCERCSRWSITGYAMQTRRALRALNWSVRIIVDALQSDDSHIFSLSRLSWHILYMFRTANSVKPGTSRASISKCQIIVWLSYPMDFRFFSAQLDRQWRW
jgi:hypothetical protein